MSDDLDLSNLDEKERKLYDKEQQDLWRSQLHDFSGKLPPHWILRMDANKRIWFRNTKLAKGEKGFSSFEHPHCGSLPEPWIYRFCTPPKPIKGVGKIGVARYYNKETQEQTKKDPRRNAEYMISENKEADKQRAIFNKTSKQKFGKIDIAGSRVMSTPGISYQTGYKRESLKKFSIRNQYEKLHTIEDPNNPGGMKGGMNGGVLIVRRKDGTGSLAVEKRFKTDEDLREVAVNEIKLVHEIRHEAINIFIDGYIVPGGDLGLYVEYCDRGDLDNLTKEYQDYNLTCMKAKTPQDRIFPPEAFIWHVYSTLCDAFAYLALGRSLVNNPEKYQTPEKGWTPILHRDVKPDNILFRSRFQSRNKYWYCVLSDFGLACHDYPDGHPEQQIQQKDGYEMGTWTHFSPELLHDPWPITDLEKKRFPAGLEGGPPEGKHSAKSDFWSLTASVHSLASALNFSHYKPGSQQPKDVQGDVWRHGRASRHMVLPKLPKAAGCTQELSDVLQLGAEADPKKRPTAGEMYKKLRDYESSDNAELVKNMTTYVELPTWLTKAHDMHAKIATPLKHVVIEPTKKKPKKAKEEE